MTTQSQPDPARAALLAARRNALSQAAQLVRMAEAQRTAAAALDRAVKRLDNAEAEAVTVTITTTTGTVSSGGLDNQP